jgi:tryptophan synthase beta chain
MPQKMIFLEESEMATAYYNILPDLPDPLAPPLHPGTGKPIQPGDLEAIFPMELIKQEMSPERFIEIPEEVQDVYRMFRPTAINPIPRSPRPITTRRQGSSGSQPRQARDSGEAH